MTQPKLNDFCKEVFEANKLKGFDVSKENIGQTLMLVVSELSEALEAHRKGNINVCRYKYDKNLSYYGWDKESIGYKEKEIESFRSYIKDSFEDEISDSFIRLMDLVGGLGIDLDWHIEQKRRFNSLREYKHGKAY
jgi:NTP pyrophosphatase (non-canonical NTP hydrolase)